MAWLDKTEQQKIDVIKQHTSNLGYEAQHQILVRYGETDAEATRLLEAAQISTDYKPKSHDPLQEFGGWAWDKIIKRFPGYAFEVADAILPIKFRNIDPHHDTMFGPVPVEIPPLLKGIWNLGAESVGGDAGYRKRRKERLAIANELFKLKRDGTISDEEYQNKLSKLEAMFTQEYGSTEQILTPRQLIKAAGRQYPTWSALYADLRDTVPLGLAGMTEALMLAEPDQLDDAYMRWWEGFKDEPWETGSLFLSAAKAKLLHRAAKLRRTAATMTPAESVKLTHKARKIESWSNRITWINPEEIAPQILGAGIQRAAPPGKSAYNPEVTGQYGVDPTGKPLTTTMRPEDFAESHLAPSYRQEGMHDMMKQLLPTAVLSDYDYAAMVEGWQRFMDNKASLKIDPSGITEQTAMGASRRFLISKQMILEQRRQHAGRFADSVGRPMRDTIDPHSAGRHGLEVSQAWKERIYKDMNNLAESIVNGTANPHDAGKLLMQHYEQWQLGKKGQYKDLFGDIEKETKTIQIQEGETDTALFPQTKAKLQQMMSEDPTNADLKAIDAVIDNMIEDLEGTEGGATVAMVDKARTNFRKRFQQAVSTGEISAIGAGDVSSLFYGTLTEDLFDHLERTLPDKVEEIRKAKEDYRTTVVDLEQSPAAVFLRNNENNPSRIIDEILNPKGTFNKDQLAVLKQVLGEDGYAAVQPALLDVFLRRARNPQTGRLYKQRLENEINKLNQEYPDRLIEVFGEENANTLLNIAKENDLEKSAAARFLEKAENAPANLIDELLKEKGVFNPDELQNLKLILGEHGFGEIQPGILGRIYEMAAAKDKNPESISPTALRNVLNTITKTNRNKLIDLLGTDTAEFLEQSALFAERFGRAQTWHKGSPTAKLASIASAPGFVPLMDEIGRMLMYRNFDISGLGPTDVLGIALITASWGSTAAYHKFIMSDAGRNWLLDGWEFGVEGNLKLSSDQLHRAATWMRDNSFEVGWTAHRLRDAQEE